MIRLLLMLAMGAGTAPLAAQTHVSTTNMPVPSLDLKRYSGQWYGIAHVPLFLQRKCARDMTATYTLREDGSLHLLSTCRQEDGDIDTVEGIARPVTGHSGTLEVRFLPRWASWMPMTWDDYWIIELDPEYRWAVIGGPDREHLWILSREPAMARTLFNQIKRRALQRGYDLDGLKLVAPLH